MRAPVQAVAVAADVEYGGAPVNATWELLTQRCLGSRERCVRVVLYQ